MEDIYDDAADGDQEVEKKKSCCFCKDLFKTYDKGFLFALGLQYFNGGTRVMLDIAFLNMFKDTFGLEPAET